MEKQQTRTGCSIHSLLYHTPPAHPPQNHSEFPLYPNTGSPAQCMALANGTLSCEQQGKLQETIWQVWHLDTTGKWRINTVISRLQNPMARNGKGLVSGESCPTETAPVSADFLHLWLSTPAYKKPAHLCFVQSSHHCLAPRKSSWLNAESPRAKVPILLGSTTGQVSDLGQIIASSPVPGTE